MSLHTLANHMAAQGRGPDSVLVHMSPREVHGLQALAMANGGSLTVNPQTGLPEAGFLDNLLPAIAGFALDAFVPGLGEGIGGLLGLSGSTASTVGTGLLVGGATGLATGSLEKGLMAGLGAYGGANLGESAFGASAAGQEAAKAAADTAIAKSPTGAFDRLNSMKEGAGALMNTPDALKNNAWNIGLASAPLLTGTFDDQQSSGASKIHPGYIRTFKTDPATGRSYQTEAVRADEWGGRPAIEWGGVPPMQRYDSGGTTTDETKKGVPVWGGVGQVELPVRTPEYAMLSDSEKAQRYLMGEGPNPFLFYHKAPTVNPVEKAAEATKEMAKVLEEQRRGGDNNRVTTDPNAGLAQFGGSGFTGATTNEYGDSGPTTGLASLANKGAAYLGNLGLTRLSDAIAKNVDPNYGHEAAVGIRQAAANVMANAPDQSQAETARLIAQNQQAAQQAAAQQTAADAADQSQAETARLNAKESDSIGFSSRGSESTSRSDGTTHDGTGFGTGYGTQGQHAEARGGLNLNGHYYPPSYAYGGGIAALADGGMYNLGSYSDGGRLLRGPGDGVSDDIPATIGQNQPARLADGEFVVPARIVSELGNGSTEAGARKLYAMMDRVQKSRSKTVGKDKIAANTRADKYLPA